MGVAVTAVAVTTVVVMVVAVTSVVERGWVTSAAGFTVGP